MSRLVADQESRGGDGDSGAGERDSVMRDELSRGVLGCQRRDVRGAGFAVCQVYWFDWLFG